MFGEELGARDDERDADDERTDRQRRAHVTITA
jgi:hypothetical protein